MILKTPFVSDIITVIIKQQSNTPNCDFCISQGSVATVLR